MGPSSSGAFLAPFKIDVWIAIFTTSILMIVVLKISGFGEKIINKSNESNSIILHIMNTIAGIAQQDFHPVSKFISKRIIIFCIMITSLIIYNYYTSSLVGSLLNSAPKGPLSTKEMIASSLEISFEDIGYHRTLFDENNSSIALDLMSKKLKPSRKGKDIPPMFTDVVTAVPYMRRGKFAFYVEVANAYPYIAKEFNANEICDLRALTGFINESGTEMTMILAKRSQYTKMFRIGLIKFQEVGLSKKANNDFASKKPICQATITVKAVTLASVNTSFYLLGLGIGVSLLLLGLEILWNAIEKGVIRRSLVI